MHKCRSCYYQELSFLGRICQYKRSVNGTEANPLQWSSNLGKAEFAEAEFVFCEEVEDCSYYTHYKDMGDAYRITNITDKKGNNKTEDRYPLRVGRMLRKPTVTPRGTAFLYFLENADGSDYAGKCKEMSSIMNVKKDDDKLILETYKTIYYIEKVKPE